MKKILLVEDDDLLNKTLTYNLISEGYDTVSALNAGTATGLLMQTEYDLVLLDISLPDGSGYDLCRLIKPENPDTLVIFLTANDQESDQIRGYEAGAVDYIFKAGHKIAHGRRTFQAVRRKFFHSSVPVKLLPMAGFRLKCPGLVTFQPHFLCRFGHFCAIWIL